MIIDATGFYFFLGVCIKIAYLIDEYVYPCGYFTLFA